MALRVPPCSGSKKRGHRIDDPPAAEVAEAIPRSPLLPVGLGQGLAGHPSVPNGPRHPRDLLHSTGCADGAAPEHKSFVARTRRAPYHHRPPHPL